MNPTDNIIDNCGSLFPRYIINAKMITRKIGFSNKFLMKRGNFGFANPQYNTKNKPTIEDMFLFLCNIDNSNAIYIYI